MRKQRTALPGARPEPAELAAESWRHVPRTADEHLLGDVETLFAFGDCRLCEARFAPERRQEHLDHHHGLFAEYAPQRARLERHRRDQEERLGARLVCETAGMPAVTEQQLRRQEQLYGPDALEELLPFLHLSGTDESRPGTDGGKRAVRRASGEDNGSPWPTPRTRNLGLRIVALRRRGRGAMAIADTLGKSDAVVRRYVREAEAAGLLRRPDNNERSRMATSMAGAS